MDSTLQLSKYLGTFAAIILFVGFLSKSGINLGGAEGITSVEEMSMMPRESNAYDEPSEVNGSRSVHIRPDEDAIPEHTERAMVMPSSRASHSRSSEPRGSLTKYDIEDWIQTNEAQTYLEASQETMSPGVILATGIYFLQQGKGDASMSAASVAAYLAEVRQGASASAKKHMKYIANSKEWFEGLNIAGFDGDKIAAIFDQYRLAAYDKQMYNRHVERKIEQKDYQVKDEVLTVDQPTRRENLADAYNSYADRPEVRAKYNLPTRVAAKPLSTKEVSRGRQEAESIKIGQSKTYDDPRLFNTVLQEMIALEQGYNNWNDYKAADAQAANKEFRSRSNIMAMGGVMKVTRQKGA